MNTRRQWMYRNIRKRTGESTSILLSPLVKPNLVKARECRRLVIKHVEHGQELRDRQQVLDLLRQVEELERAALFLDRRKARHKLADAARIDIADAAEVEQDLVLALAEQPADGISKRDAALTDRDLAVHVEDRNIAGLPFADIDIRH